MSSRPTQRSSARGIASAPKEHSVRAAAGTAATTEATKTVSRPIAYPVAGVALAAAAVFQILSTPIVYDIIGAPGPNYSQICFARSFAAGITQLAFTAFAAYFSQLWTSFQRLNFSLALAGVLYIIPVALAYSEGLIAKQYTIVAGVLSAVVVLFPLKNSRFNLGETLEGVAHGLKNFFRVTGPLSFFLLLSGLLGFAAQPLVTYPNPTKILPPDLIAEPARNAVILFARGMSSASLSAAVSVAILKDAVDRKKGDYGVFKILALGLLVMASIMSIIGFQNGTSPGGLLETKPSYFYMRMSINIFNALVSGFTLLFAHIQDEA